MAVHASVGEAIAKAEESLEASEKITPRVSPRGPAVAVTALSGSETPMKSSPSSKVSVGDDVMHDVPIHDEEEVTHEESTEGWLAGLKARVRALKEEDNGGGRDMGPGPSPLPFTKLYKYMDRYDVVLQVLGIIGALGNGVIFPIFTIIFGDILDDIAINYYIFNDPSALTNAVNTTVPKFMYLGVGGCVAAFLQVYCLGYSGVRQGNRLREAFFKRVLEQDIAYFDTQGTSGVVLEGLTADCQTVQKTIGEKFSMSLFFTSTFISGMVIAFTKGWDITLVLLAFMPILVITGFFSSMALRRINLHTSKAASEASTLAQEALANIRTVFSYNGEERTVKSYDDALAGPEAVGTRQGFFNGLTIGMTTFVTYCGYALSMWYGSTQISFPDGYTGGDVINVLLSALIGGFALGQAVPNYQSFQEGRVAAAKVHAVIEREPEMKADGIVPDEVTGVIRFDNVTFAYPSRPDKVVFRDFSLTVDAGQTVALVGESGSGKSTAVSLMERFYDPQSGGVFLDGENVKDLDLCWLRSQIGLVSQEPTLFATSIRENILFGKPDATEDEIVAAAKSANAHRFISALPDGYDTHVGEKGVQMSGGQKQRIAIARAILKNPRVLLLDEATSALDAESERVVQDALDRLMVGRTTVVVAHRLSTIRNADVIAVVKQGAVIERGDHESLIRKKGAYAALVQMQGAVEAENGKNGNLGGSLPGDTTKALSQHFGYFGRTAGQGVLELAKEGQEVAQALTHAVRRTSSHEVAAVESGDSFALESTIETSPSKTKKLRRRRWWARSEAPPATSAAPADGDDGPAVDKKRIALLNKPEMPAAITGIIGSVGMGMVMPSFSIVFSTMIGFFYQYALEPSKLQSEASKYAGVFVAIGFGALLSAIIQNYSFNYMGQRLGRRVRVLTMQALLRQEVGFFDQEKNSSGVLTSKLTTDAMAVKGQFGDSMGLITQNFVTLVGGLVIAGVYDWRMMLLVVGCLPLLALVVGIQTKLIVKYVNNESEEFASANRAASEAVLAIKTVAAFNMQANIADLYRRLLIDPAKRSEKSKRTSAIGFGFNQIVIFGIFSLAFWFAGEEVSSERASFTEVLKSFFAVFLAAFSTAQSQLHFPDVAKGKAAAKRVFAIIDRQPLIASEGGAKSVEVTGNIELRNVTFAYPSRPDTDVFTDFSLSVEAGKTVALVGESGSGKSSVVSLIERFYDPISGGVFLDDQNIKDIDLQYLRSQIGLVSQEPVLFNMSVADNIAYGCPDASMERIQEAARAANAHGFIEALPEGYHTMLGEGCIQLSGGQKQRVAIARAIVKDPKILLLDEATSALDAESERVVQDALDRLMVGRTTVVVAHRLSTIRDADTIAVVYKGHIVEQGTHQELVAMNGSYARLVGGQQQS